MMVTCILTSYNRPNFVRQALRSIERQTWKNYEVLLLDESDPGTLDISKVVQEFKFPSLWVNVSKVSPQERATENRLGKTINLALARAAGELVCYLADDDFYFEDWFEEAVKYFTQWPTVLQAFGALHYSGCREMRFDQANGVRFFDKPVMDPFGVLDHSQVMHRRRNSPVLWPTWTGTQKEPDAYFFRELAKSGPFYPIMSAAAAVKRLHPKNLQRCVGNSLEGVRE